MPEYQPDWYALVRFKGKQQMFCTDTRDKRVAEQRAAAALKAMKDERWEGMVKPLAGGKGAAAGPSLEVVCAQLLAGTPAGKLPAARKNVANLKSIVQLALGRWEGVMVRELCGAEGKELVLRWMRLRQRYQGLLCELEDAEEVLEGTGWMDAAAGLRRALVGRRAGCVEREVVAARGALEALEAGEPERAVGLAAEAGFEDLAWSLRAGAPAWRECERIRGEMEGDSLRAALASGSLAPLDPDTRREGNATINSMLNQAQAVFSGRAQNFRLAGLDVAGVASGFGAVGKIAAAPVGFVPIEKDVYDRMHAAACGLRVSDPQLWLVNQMLRRLGLRSGELMAARDSWLWEDVEGWRRAGRGWVLVVKDRPEEGFYLKSGKAKERFLPLDDDLAAVLVGRQGNLLGCITPGEAYALVARRHNQWLRQFIPDRQKGNHELRKHIGAIIYSSLGKEAAADYLGHATSVTTERFYAAWMGRRPTITERDLEETSCLSRLKV